MAEHQRRNVHGVGKQVPGCLGRMVNLFDPGTGVGEHKMLADKPHLAGSSLLRSRSDVTQMPSHLFGDRVEDKVIVSEVRNNTQRVNGTPIKKLIAQEMSKELDYRLSPNNVVAKLMGLDSLPRQQPNNTFARGRNLRGHSRRSLSHEATALQCWEQDCDLGYQDPREYKDVYEIWQQPRKLNNCRSSLADNGRYDGSLSEKKMDVVRKKFMEAKRLVTDEKLRHSKEFQDAVEVLSSNKDLFVKFLQESNNFFAQHLHDFQSVATSPETKRITILKPSKMTEDEKLAGQVKKADNQTNRATSGSPLGSMNSEFALSFLSQMVDEYPMQSTRIVVLKPKPANVHPGTALASPCPTFPIGLCGEGSSEEPDDFEERYSRDMAGRVTKQMNAKLMEFQLNETLQSSVFSNGYVCDDSSCNRSENDYVIENLSDCEIMSPTSRHSWDDINRYGSPYSSSPVSRASFSPESSVCREAKKRLSERWALIASNGNFQEQNSIQKSTSTLGEMLALSNSKKNLRLEEAKYNKEQEDPRVSTACLTGNFSRDEGGSNTLRILQRSKSVPESSTVYKTNIECKVSETTKDGKANVPEELKKSKSLKSSLKGKVSNFFFSRIKKDSKEKANTSQSKNETQAVSCERIDSPAICLAQTSDDASHSANDYYFEQGSLPGTRQKGNRHSGEADLSSALPPTLGIVSSLDRPSPISVLETSFKEDDRIIPESSMLAQPASQGPELFLRSNLIDKAPPIGSISRTIPWEGSRMEKTMTRHYAAKRSTSAYSTDTDEEEEEEDWRLLISTLLSATDLNAVSVSDNPLSRWHSPESPLDPSLGNKYVHEAKRHRLRSKRKLVFDLVNSSLLEMVTRRQNSHLSNGKQLETLGDHVWNQMQELFSSNEEELWDDDGDLSSLAVDRVVQSEAAENGWPDTMRWEMDDLGKELEGKLLEELVGETLTDLTDVGCH